MTDLTEQEVCIGSLGQQKVYLNWSDVKDICTHAVSATYEQVKKENAQLKELLKECKKILCESQTTNPIVYFRWENDLINKIDEVLK